MLKEEGAVIALALVVALAYFAAPGPAGGAGNHPPSIWSALTGAPNASGSGAAQPAAPPESGAGGPRVSLSVSPLQPVAGQAVGVQAILAGCPRAPTNLTLDGQPLSYDWAADGSSLTSRLQPAAGRHTVAVSSPGPGCQAEAEFDVLPAQCSGTQTQSCAIGGCPGTQACENSRWGECAPLPPICQPGARVPCSSNTCAFGLAQCNACGTGWLECRPPDSYNN